MASRSRTRSPASLDDPALYLNRELTWLDYNRRVLDLARSADWPILERLRFLSIADATLDEFVMKRIGGLKQQVGAGVRERSIDGRTPEEQVRACVEVIRGTKKMQLEVLSELVAQLAEDGIHIVNHAELDEADRERARRDYLDDVFPLVTPQVIDPAHPFPFISNLSLNLLLTLQHGSEHRTVWARVKVPVGAGVRRFQRIGDSRVFVPLEQIMAHHVGRLFPDAEVDRCAAFRVTRNANTETDEEEADDLLEMIELELRERRFAPIVRVEVDAAADPDDRRLLAEQLGLDSDFDVYATAGMLGLRDLGEVASLTAPRGLHFPVHRPVDPLGFAGDRTVFEAIRESGPILVHQPYESFATSVERFLSEAALDPDVRAIKMTLYRTSRESPIVEHLIEAGRQGKHVTVVVELKARFDEEANIRWAARLEQAGIHVNYGVVGLKTHCKVLLVVRREQDGLVRYVHIGTGNYHSETARTYGDLNLFTCEAAIGRDAGELFNFLTTGVKPDRDYTDLLVAPKRMKRAILDAVQEEIRHQREGKGGWIRWKANALEDRDVTQALYEAAREGVRIELVVRDTCRFRAGVKGLSESARVVSIVGRFLEHARILHFGAGGKNRYYIGSADLMYRNLESRIEVLCPVREARLKAELDRILTAQLVDRAGAWEMQRDGTYTKLKPRKGDSDERSQEVFQRVASGQRPRARRRKGAA